MHLVYGYIRSTVLYVCIPSLMVEYLAACTCLAELSCSLALALCPFTFCPGASYGLFVVPRRLAEIVHSLFAGCLNQERPLLE